MTKRGADKPLDYDNWDAPDDPIKPGAFEKADEATIKARNIIIPRRKSVQMVTQTKRGLFKSIDVFGASQNSSPSSNSPSLKSEYMSDAYLSKLAALNKEVSAWISKHVAEDPYCILTPIFNDYAKHLASIETSTSNLTSDVSTSLPATIASTSVEESSAPKTTFSVPSPQSTIVSTMATTTTTRISTGFNFQFKSDAPAVTSIAPKSSLFSDLGTVISSSNNSSSKPLIFPCSSAPIKLAENPSSSVAATTDSNTDQGDDEEYVPPKPEVKEIKEEGSVYTVRCKLFYKSTDQWVERGLGNLHIIPLSDEKFQLLVRADTNLGNILLNIMVTKDIPMQLQKNNITFACIPFPPLPGTTKSKEEAEISSPPRPVPMLIRVKDSEVAESLLVEIDTHRGKRSK